MLIYVGSTHAYIISPFQGFSETFHHTGQKGLMNVFNGNLSNGELKCLKNTQRKKNLRKVLRLHIICLSLQQIKNFQKLFH